MPNSLYDIVIIGAGIQGAGVAQAVANYGYKTLILEQYPGPGMATSSKSSKLIHGGLRYLESGQFSLVRECLNERNILLKNAPGLVKKIPFYIPVYQHSRRPAWHIWLGLVVYSIFSLTPFAVIREKHWKDFSQLNKKNLKQLFMYYDAQTDDMELTAAVIESAKTLGAEIHYNSTFHSAERENSTYSIHYSQDSRQLHVKSRCIINCAGPWIESVQKKIKPQMELPEIDLVAGTHILINQITEHGAFYIEASDGRAVFVIPWKDKKTLIGTTERLFEDRPETLQPLQSEIDYLIETYNKYFSKTISQKDIISSFAGLRVLPHSDNTAFNRPRDSIIVEHPSCPGLITLVGGKLTAYRASAEHVLKHAIKTLGQLKDYKHTRDIRLNA